MFHLLYPVNSKHGPLEIDKPSYHRAVALDLWSGGTSAAVEGHRRRRRLSQHSFPCHCRLRRHNQWRRMARQRERITKTTRACSKIASDAGIGISSPVPAPSRCLMKGRYPRPAPHCRVIMRQTPCQMDRTAAVRSRAAPARRASGRPDTRGCGHHAA